MKGDAGVKGEPVSIIVSCNFVPKYMVKKKPCVSWVVSFSNFVVLVGCRVMLALKV